MKIPASISKFLFAGSLFALAMPLCAQQPAASSTQKPAAPAMKHEDTEVYEPVPKVVTPGATDSAPRSWEPCLARSQCCRRSAWRSDRGPAGGSTTHSAAISGSTSPRASSDSARLRLPSPSVRRGSATKGYTQSWHRVQATNPSDQAVCGWGASAVIAGGGICVAGARHLPASMSAICRSRAAITKRENGPACKYMAASMPT